jgi:hypothetical protein
MMSVGLGKAMLGDVGAVLVVLATANTVDRCRAHADAYMQHGVDQVILLVTLKSTGHVPHWGKSLGRQGPGSSPHHPVQPAQQQTGLPVGSEVPEALPGPLVTAAGAGPRVMAPGEAPEAVVTATGAAVRHPVRAQPRPGCLRSSVGCWAAAAAAAALARVPGAGPRVPERARGTAAEPRSRLERGLGISSCACGVWDWGLVQLPAALGAAGPRVPLPPAKARAQVRGAGLAQAPDWGLGREKG